MTTDPVAPRSTGLPLSALVVAPVAAAALAYTADVVLGADAWVLTTAPGTGVQMYGIATAVFCALEGLLVIPGYLRAGRYVHAAGLLLYLAVVAAVVFWLASFQTQPQ